MINLHHLHYFYVCAQIGNVTKAAAKLGISQPSLSMQIKQFEKQIGMQVLARSGRTLALTPRGKVLFEHSSRFFQVTEEIERFIRKSETTKSFDLRIGVSDEVERPFAADVLGKLMKIHGSKRISSTIVSGTHQSIVDLLADDQTDVVISTQKISGSSLLAELKIPVILATRRSPESLRIGKSSNVQSALEQLGQSLILPMSQMVLGKETRHFLKANGVKSFTSLQSNILACIVRAVEEGVGAAFLPAVYVSQQIKNGLLTTVGVSEGYWKHTLYVYAEKGSGNEFIGELVKVINDLNALK
jgi:LysR family transcriptional regulator, transcriptional activator of nhaA